MTQLPILVPAANLTKSPSNVRKQSEAVADAQLEANIAAKGVRQNLIGVPVARKKGHYRIIAGGRRLDAVHRLIEKGVFAADYAISVLILRDAADAIATSLEENFLVLGMNPADTCRAFQDIIQIEGKTPEEVAIRFGLTERFVKSRLALADLAEPVFEALQSGEITISVASAYAAENCDRERQAEVFDLLKGSYQRSNVDQIRRMLAEGTCLGSDPKALLVGRDAYVAAGGRVHGDLFTTEATERWIDGALITRLAAERLATAAEELRAREGYAEVRARPSTFISYNDTWDLRPLVADTPALTPEQESRLEEIQQELGEINAALEEGSSEEQEELTNRSELLEAEYRALDNPLPMLSDEQKRSALAYIVIGHDGQPRIHEQLYVVPADEAESDEGEADLLDSEPSEVESEEQETGKPVYSQRLGFELAEMKSEMIRLHIASDPRFALDLGTFWMADKAVHSYGTADLATELRANEAPSPLVGYESGTQAGEQWSKLGEGLDRSWTDHDDVRDRFDAFCSLPDDARAAWMSWTVAQTLHAVPAGKDGCAFIDHLGTRLEIDVAAWWRPTEINYFDRISKGAILSHLEEVGGKELSSRYGGSKKRELAVSAARIFAGTVPIEPAIRDAAIAWVPDVMRFTPLVTGETDLAAEGGATEAQDQDPVAKAA